MVCLGDIEDEDIDFVYKSDICRITMIVASKCGVMPFLAQPGYPEEKGADTGFRVFHITKTTSSRRM